MGTSQDESNQDGRGPFAPGQSLQNPERDGAVESHPCAENAQGWRTRPGEMGQALHAAQLS